jgi:hypothetical protein
MDPVGTGEQTGRWVRRGEAIELVIDRGPELEEEEEVWDWLKKRFGGRQTPTKALPPGKPDTVYRALAAPPPSEPSPATPPVPPVPKAPRPVGKTNRQILEERLKAANATLEAASIKAYRKGMTDAARAELAELRRARDAIQMQINLLPPPGSSELELQLGPPDDPAVLQLCRTAAVYAAQLAEVRSTRLPPGASPGTRRVPTKAPGYLEATQWMNRNAQQMTSDRMRQMSRADIDRVVGCLGRIEAVVDGRPSVYMQRMRANAAAVLASPRP